MHSQARSKGGQAKALPVFLQPLHMWVALEGAACSWDMTSPSVNASRRSSHCLTQQGSLKIQDPIKLIAKLTVTMVMFYMYNN